MLQSGSNARQGQRQSTLRCLCYLIGLAAFLMSKTDGLFAGDDPPATPQEAKPIAPEDLEFFEKRIRPLFVQHCHECHSSNSKILKGNLRLDSWQGLKAGGDSGPVITHGKPDESLLIEAIRYGQGSPQMPPAGKLPDDAIASLEEWVRRGAPFPQGTETGPARKREIDFAAARSYWSFLPLREVDSPAVSLTNWPRKKVDHFIVQSLEQKGLSPSPAADKRTMIRRAYFDLIGLPPAPEEVQAFEQDNSADAWPKLVDRLLESPHYGERWGRYWLDLARFSDKTAPWLSDIGRAYAYRDWVIDAFNRDLPYDKFVHQQLANDLLPDGKPADMAALGYLGLSPTYWKELKLDKSVIKTIVADEWDEKIDAVGRTFLGLTLACARCHDHKFDPISQEDYYALAGIFASTSPQDRAMIDGPDAKVVEQARELVISLRAKTEKLKIDTSKEAQAQLKEIEELIAHMERSTPNYKTGLCHAVADVSLFVEADGPSRTRLDYKAGIAQDLPVMIRGNIANPGKIVPRRFLRVLSQDPPVVFQQGSGRLDLAKAITNEAAPLTARVIVNRVWGYHFGRPMVDTPSNFGVNGSAPTHPELLEDLAERFVKNGWSLKWLHRELMLSATYQQAVVDHPKGMELDADNRLLWRMNRRRLEIEPWRDNMLAAAGTLDRTIHGEAIELDDPNNHRRTVYSLVDRHQLHQVFRLYDFPDPEFHSPAREPTTTPLQQLFVLNGPFFQQTAKEFAARLEKDAPAGGQARIERAYQVLFNRQPTPRETSLAEQFLQNCQASGADPATAWNDYCHVLLASNETMFVD